MGPVLIFSSHHAHSHPFFLLNHLFCFPAGWCSPYISINPLKRKKHAPWSYSPSPMTSSPAPHVFAANLQGLVDIHGLHLLFSHSLSHPLWPCSDLLLSGDCFVKAIRDPMWINPTVSFQSSSYSALQQRLTALPSLLLGVPSLLDTQLIFLPVFCFLGTAIHLRCRLLFLQCFNVGYPRVQGLPLYLCSFLWW